ncbi:MAG: TraB/GumN family protein, partial [Zoogloea sp.]|nr:TraB/GumN family protein [Zoogloea sp.]
MRVGCRALLSLAFVLWAGLAAAGGPLFLWELKDARGALRGWLYGTIHVCDAACFPLPAPVRDALASAGGLALELDPADPALGPALARAGALP